MNQEFSTPSINATSIADILAIVFTGDEVVNLDKNSSIYSVESENFCEMNLLLSTSSQPISPIPIPLINSTLHSLLNK